MTHHRPSSPIPHHATYLRVYPRLQSLGGRVPHDVLLGHQPLDHLQEAAQVFLWTGDLALGDVEKQRTDSANLWGGLGGKMGWVGVWGGSGDVRKICC
jgi:hypothetical protein